MLEILRASLTRRLEPAHRLLLAQLVMFTGVAALFPVVPLYVREHGGSSADVALFIAGPLVASTLVQVPAGHLVDRVGRRPMLIGSRIAFAALSFGLFADRGPLWLLALLRVGQGASSGAYLPALRAALADLTPVGQRGMRYAQLQACEMVGLLLGPAIGGAIALWRYSGIFAACGVSVLVGLGTLIRMPETRLAGAVETTPHPAGVAAAGGSPSSAPGSAPPLPGRWWWRAALLVPAGTLAAVGAMFNMYDVVWPQYLQVRGYDTLVIGLSISFFAVPILLLAGRAGRLSDRANRRLLIPAALAVVAGCASTYPELRSIYTILLVGTAEAIAMVVIEPSLYALISEAADVRVRGRAMGLGGFFEAAGGALGAGVLGALYGIAEPVPFWGGAACCVLAALVCLVALPTPRAPGPGPARFAVAPEPLDTVPAELNLTLSGRPGLE
ncbi:MAG TPA: MFS transporter [Candidatus Binatia bacterium]|nr:MFS transporter [Candidatus Binatia bacterium]